MSLQKVGAERKPMLACVGTISSISPTEVTKSEKYLMNKFTISPEGAGQTAYGYFLWRPEFFDGQSSILEAEKGVQFVYSNNILGEEVTAAKTFPGCVTTLAGLLGPERFEEFANGDTFAGLTGEEMAEKMNALLADSVGRAVGYILNQRMEKAGDTKIPTKNYELLGMFEPTPENLAALKKKAKKSETKDVRYQIKLMYDTDVPFGQGAANAS